MKKKKNKNKIANTILSNVFIWVIIVIAAISIANNFSPFEKTKEISYTEYQNSRFIVGSINSLPLARKDSES